MMVMLRTVAVSAIALGLAAPAMAEDYASGSAGGLTWEARSRIIGQTPTSNVLPGTPANATGGGDPIYKPTADKDGVVALIIERSNGLFICSGSLMSNRMSIVTAGHCVSDGFGTPDPIKVTAYFFDGNADSRTPFGTGVRAVEISKIAVASGYTGEVIDQNDIAVLRLSTGVLNTNNAYDLYTQGDLTGKDFNVAGYGTRSTVGGAAGETPPAGARTGYLREGDNRFDYAWGDPRFDGFFTDVIDGENFFGTADIEFSYVSDFDNGLAAQDQSYRICRGVGGSIATCAPFQDVGLGAREVGIAGGDSGGPGFIDGKLASVNSYGLTFGTNFGDFGGGLNSGWGEFSGYVPTFIHEDFIESAMAVPEPATWAMMLMGFGAVGFATRRARVTKVSLA